MILYDLACEKGHEFEGWFKDRESFEEQKTRGLIQCTVCGSSQISLRPSGFAIKTSKGFKPAVKAVRAFFQFVQDYVDKNFEDVDAQFAQEALKMHYGQAEKRNIRGVATEREEEMLREEGVQFRKITIPKFDA